MNTLNAIGIADAIAVRTTQEFAIAVLKAMGREVDAYGIYTSNRIEVNVGSDSVSIWDGNRRLLREKDLNAADMAALERIRSEAHARAVAAIEAEYAPVVVTTELMPLNPSSDVDGGDLDGDNEAGR